MKMKYFNLFLIGGVLLLGWGCTEIPPVITPLTPTDPNAAAIPRRVLIEEFTGVRCVNCPAGTADILNLQSLYPERLIAVGIHAGSFSLPYAESRIDFRTEEGNGIINLLGRPLGYPSAVVNRKKFDGEFDLQLGRSQWAGLIAQELAIPPQVEVALAPEYSRTNRQLRLTVTVTPQPSYAQTELRYSVMLLEDQVVDWQLTPDGKQENYAHRHNLRKMLTPFDGEDITAAVANGRPFSTTFTYTLPVEWNEARVSVVGFAHGGGSTNLEVLQAAYRKINP